jgi:hypothetical protein
MAVALRRALQHWQIFVPLAPAAQNIGVGLRQRFRGKACDGMLGAMVRIAPPQDCEARFFVDSCKRFISILQEYYFLFLSI